MTTGPGGIGQVVRDWRRQLPGDLDPRTVAVVAIALAFISYRTWLATQSGFGFHQGWNEGHYALIAHGFLEHPLVPRYGSNHVFNVPPLFPYLVAAFFATLGESALVARLPSILATAGAVLATYALGRVVYGDRTVSAVGAGIFALLPFVQLYGGRAQTDMLMTFLFTAALACIVYGHRDGGWRWPIVGGATFAGALATKQPAGLLAVIVFGWLWLQDGFDRETMRKVGLWLLATGVALLPLLTWWYLNFQAAPSAFVQDWGHELFGRTVPFANVPLLFVVGLGLGVTPLVVALVGYAGATAYRRYSNVASLRAAGHPNVLVVWLVVYGAFVLYRTPRGHQYYLLTMTPAIALLAASGFRSIRKSKVHGRVVIAIALLVVLNLLVGSVLLFELSGEYSLANGGGESVATETSAWLESEVAAGATILVVNEYRPPIQWYLRSDVESDRIRSYLAADLTPNRLARVRASAEGPVYIVYPMPSWGPDPGETASPIYRSNSYEFTVMDGIGGFVSTDSKYAFYLEGRSLVVFRLTDDTTDH